MDNYVGQRSFLMFLSSRILLVEGLFSKYGTTGEGNVRKPGRHVSDNMIPRLTERHFLRKVQPTGGKKQTT
jgi:hypothetical protein